MVSDDRPNVYTEDGKTIWRASALGNCQTSLAWAYLGTEAEPAPEFLHAAFEEGAAMEDTLIDKLIDKHNLKPLDDPPFEVDDSGQYVLELAWGSHVVRCHPDGVFDSAYGPVVVEVKFVGDALWNKLNKDIKLVPNYAWQASVEMAASDMKLVYGIGRKDPETRKLVEFTDKLYYDAPYSKGQIKKRVAEVVTMTKEEDMPHCEYPMFPCAYWPFHTETDPAWAKDQVVLDGDQAAIFEEVIARYEKARATIADAEKDRKEAGHAFSMITRELELKGGERIIGGETEVTFVKQNRTRVDWKKLAADHEIDPSEYEEGYEVVYPKKVAK